MSIKRSSTFTRLLLFLSQGRAQGPADPQRPLTWPPLPPRAPTGWAAPTGWVLPQHLGDAGPRPPSSLHKLSRSLSRGGGSSVPPPAPRSPLGRRRLLR